MRMWSLAVLFDVGMSMVAERLEFTMVLLSTKSHVGEYY